MFNEYRVKLSKCTGERSFPACMLCVFAKLVFDFRQCFIQNEQVNVIVILL